MLQESIEHSGTAARKLLEACTDLQSQWANTCTQALKSMMDDRWSESYNRPYRFANECLRNSARWQFETLCSATKMFHGGMFAWTPGMREAAEQYETLIDKAVAEQSEMFDTLVEQLYAPLERANELAFECLAATEEFSERIVSLGAREASKTAAVIEKDKPKKAA